ncbi:hypothetical protein ANCCEY_04447 [Ancylostoma ceylanicum]|uniref:Uncharacterized protein n=1 Tax=Ancylostoma ceylanicum TaxID=53326 RepID=A0A0D6LZ26_9BILA|nr:hypothetical protein ANCCEY_04447 [Ancylostoma ceylanicum]
MIGQDLSPKALHGYLTSLMYARYVFPFGVLGLGLNTLLYSRTRMNPLWNTLIVAGVEDEEKNNKETSNPFIGVITQKGVAYQTKHVATGIAAMLLNQAVEDEWRKKGEKLTRPEAEAILRKALELTIYHDCCADNDFELGVVDAEEGVILGKQVRKPSLVTGASQKLTVNTNKPLFYVFVKCELCEYLILSLLFFFKWFNANKYSPFRILHIGSL